MIRMLEIAWLIIAIVVALIGVYKLYSGFNEEAIVMFIGAAIAGFMFSLRRKQRQKMEYQENDRQSKE